MRPVSRRGSRIRFPSEADKENKINISASAWLSAHAGVLLIEWPDSEMYTELLEA